MIEATEGIWYFIYPFLLDPTLLKRKNEKGESKNERSKNNPLILALDELGFQEGLLNSRKGFLPLRPYTAVKKEVRGREIERTDLNTISYIFPQGSPLTSDLTLDVKVKEALMIRSTGVGVLTYEVTPDSNKLGGKEFQLFSRLVPRMYGWKEEEGPTYREEDKPYAAFCGDEKKVLQKIAYESINGFVESVLDFVKMDTEQGGEFWEDREVYTLNGGDEFPQPYVVNNLKLEKNSLTKSVENVDILHHAVKPIKKLFVWSIVFGTKLRREPKGLALGLSEKLVVLRR